MAFFRKKLAIDLGSANTLFYLKGKGVILAEPAVVAINYWEKKAVAVGHKAKGFMGRTPQHIKAFRPLKDGFMADLTSTMVMLAQFYEKIFNHKKRKSKWVLIVPTAITAETKKEIRESARGVGCSKISFLSESMAAALGAGFDVKANRGRIIINIGGAICEIAVIINGTVTFSRVTSFAGDALDDAVIKHLKEKYGVHISENMAEKCKHAIGSALPQIRDVFPLIGKDMKTNVPRALEVKALELQQAIREPLDVLKNFLKECLAAISAAHIKDAREDGILLVGGGTLLPGLDTFLTAELGFAMVRDKEPLLTVIKGGGIALERPLKYRKIFMK
ncbi:MAG: rod shape-determining protein [Desulfurivibrionaceae bacterium]|nr:rod shape-determining protein [Desulfurivibrionaceae bacterium]